MTSNLNTDFDERVEMLADTMQIAIAGLIKVTEEAKAKNIPELSTKIEFWEECTNNIFNAVDDLHPCAAFGQMQ